MRNSPFALILIAVFVMTAAAQEAINVRSMKISQIGPAGTRIEFEMNALNSSQQMVNYLVLDSSAINTLPEYSRCSPCNPPQVFSTNVFSNPISVQIGQSSIVIKFYLNSPYSETAYLLGQRVYGRKRDITLSGVTRLQGKIEIINTGQPGQPVLAFDNDVLLEGRYSMVFGKPYALLNGGFFTDYRSMVFDLNDSH